MNKKRAHEGVDIGSLKWLENSMDPPTPSLNNSCPWLLPWRPKSGHVIHSTLRKTRGKGYKEVDHGKMKNMKTTPTTMLHVL